MLLFFFSVQSLFNGNYSYIEMKQKVIQAKHRLTNTTDYYNLSQTKEKTK